jgi:anti-sigma factor RsiW
MHRDEAKYLLSAYRPDGQDAADPQFHDALELLKIDPELARWFAEERALDRALAAKFAAFPVPPQLKHQLLAARKVVRPAAPWWQRPGWITAAAAALTLLLIVLALSWPSTQRTELADLGAYLGAVAAGRAGGLEMIRDLPAVRQWLGEHGAPADFVLPAGLASLPSLGCRVLEWNGHPVAFVCFELPNQERVHLFVLDRQAVPGARSNSAPGVATLRDGIQALWWADTRRVYVLAGRQSGADLRRFL